MRRWMFHTIQQVRAALDFVGLVCLSIGLAGCSGQTPDTSIASSQTSAKHEASPSLSAQPIPTNTANRVVQNKDSKTSGVEVANSDPASSTVETSSSAMDTQTLQNQPGADSSVPVTANRGDPKEVKPVKTPTQEQIVRWGDLQREPLQLLACYDGFGDSFVNCFAATPDGARFVLGGAKLTLWNISQAEPTVDLLAGYNSGEVERPIRSVAICPKGMFVAAGDQKGMLRVWNLDDQRESVAIRAHDARLIHLAFSPDSQTIATTSYTGEVRLWETSTGKSIKTIPVSDRELAGLAFVRDDLLAVAGEMTGLWDLSVDEMKVQLTPKRAIQQALGVSHDHEIVAFVDAEAITRFWDIKSGALIPLNFRDAVPRVIEFSSDGKRLATLDQDGHLRIRDALTGQIVQVIDGNGSKAVGVKWHPAGALLVASDLGRLRLWGTKDLAGQTSYVSITLPTVDPISNQNQYSASSAQLQNVIDLRSFPKLPGAVPQWSDFGLVTYQAVATSDEAEAFYRYVLGTFGWAEFSQGSTPQSGLSFSKDHCNLNLSFQPVEVPGQEGLLQVTLQFAGNYDVRKLPRIRSLDSKSDWSSCSFASYRSEAELTELEVGLLKQFHDLGWTAYSRLNSSNSEDSFSRTLNFLNRGAMLTVFIRPPADAPKQLAVQVSLSVTTKSLPIPPDAGWIEFDSSTDLQMVANTRMDLNQSIEFYDQQMMAEGWLARDAGRKIEEKTAWLPYLRGQQDVQVRLTELAQGGTRIVVGDAEKSSWQFEKEASKDGEATESLLEAADFVLPKGSTEVNFDLDQKLIQFAIVDMSPQKVASVFVEQLQELGWKREESGVTSDEYVLVTCSKGKAEIQLRARSISAKTTVMVSGDGLAWGKPLPAAPVRISYGTWLRRERKAATLELLDEFAKEMLGLQPVKQDAK